MPTFQHTNNEYLPVMTVDDISANIEYLCLGSSHICRTHFTDRKNIASITIEAAPIRTQFLSWGTEALLLMKQSSMEKTSPNLSSCVLRS